MAGGNRRKCKCCLALFRPDPRNRHHQRYCSAAACRAASKAAGPSPLARRAGRNQGILPRSAQRRSGPGVAVASSGIGAELDVSALRYKISQRRNPLIPRSISRTLAGSPLQRGLNRATCCSDWLNRPYRRDAVTRCQHRPAPRGVCYGWGKTFSLHLRHGRQRSGLTAEPAVID